MDQLKVSVIVTAAGSVVGEGIIKCLKLANAAKSKHANYEIIALEMSPLGAGLYRADRGILVPSPESPNFVDKVIEICKGYSVKAIFVGSDEELMALAVEAERIEDESGARVITNSSEIVSTGKDKWKTYEFLKKENFPRAESALPDNRNEFVRMFGFPVIVKPREGHGSEQFHIVNNEEELNQAVASIERAGMRAVLQEYLDAKDAEFTTGIVLNKGGTSVLSSISMRRILKHGQTYKAFVQDYSTVRKSAEEVAMKLGSRGPLNIQSRIVGGEPKIFEINPRFSASCPIRAASGVNEPDIIIRDQVLGEKIELEPYREIVCLRYWNEVYVPYDSFLKLSDNQKIEDSGSFIPDYF